MFLQADQGMQLLLSPISLSTILYISVKVNKRGFLPDAPCGEWTGVWMQGMPPTVHPIISWVKVIWK